MEEDNIEWSYVIAFGQFASTRQNMFNNLELLGLRGTRL